MIEPIFQLEAGGDPRMLELAQKRRLTRRVRATANQDAEDIEAKDGRRESVRGFPVLNWEVSEKVAAAKPRVLVEHTADSDVEFLDNSSLPEVDAVVMTWTSEEWDPLHYVFSNDLEPLPSQTSDNRIWRNKWLPYRRDMWTVLDDLWTQRLISKSWNYGPRVPALNSYSRRWGSFIVVEIHEKKVLLFKSDLHINQDGYTLPLIQLCNQILEDCKPKLILSVGTSGGTRLEDNLGDTVVTNSGKFRCGDEFKTAAFNHKTYSSDWTPSESYLPEAHDMLISVPEYPVNALSQFHEKGQIAYNPKSEHDPKIKICDIPLLTTDFFEYGQTGDDYLGNEGCCVEMDDAVVGMVCDKFNRSVRGGKKNGVQYGFLRNISDPVLNHQMPKQLQIAWAVATYKKLGMKTSFNSAVATWAMLAGWSIEGAN